MSFSKISEIIEASQSRKLPLWKVILDDDIQERKVTEKESFSRMEKMLDAMLEADKKYNPDLRSQSGLSGGDGAKLETFRKQENRLIGTFMTMVMEKAVKMAESNACMGRIVAAPTAGSCGVIPAVLLPYLEEKKILSAFPSVSFSSAVSVVSLSVCSSFSAFRLALSASRSSWSDGIFLGK